jgi:hypothetical protein
MNRGDARRRLLVAANELGYHQGANGRPFPPNTPAYIAQRAALAAGLGTLRARELAAWSRDVYTQYRAGWDAARAAEAR